MKFQYTDGRNSNFIALCHQLDDFLNQLVGGEQNRAQYLPYNTLEDIHHVVLLWDGDQPVGCAAFKEYDGQRAEVKRVFLRPEYRGKGLGRQLLEALEVLAKRKGYSALILESGEPLAAAMKLYRFLGYEVIPNYGPYVNLPESICMEKKL